MITDLMAHKEVREILKILLRDPDETHNLSEKLYEKDCDPKATAFAFGILEAYGIIELDVDFMKSYEIEFKARLRENDLTDSLIIANNCLMEEEENFVLRADFSDPDFKKDVEKIQGRKIEARDFKDKSLKLDKLPGMIRTWNESFRISPNATEEEKRAYVALMEELQKLDDKGKIDDFADFIEKISKL